MPLADFDDGTRPGPGELEGVSDQVLKNLLDQAWVAHRGGQLRNLPIHHPAFGFRLQQGHDLFDHRIQIGGLEFERLTANPRQIQQLIHQQPHAVNPIFNALQVTLRFRGHSRAKILRQDLGKPADVPQRRPQIVRHGVGKSFQLAVGGFQLRRPLCHPLFQFLIQFADFPLVRSSPCHVAESGHAATHRSVPIFQGTGVDLNPDSFVELGITHKHFGSACFSADGACQWRLVGGEGRQKAIVRRPFLAGQVGCAHAKNLCRGRIPEDDCSLPVGGDQSLLHAVQHGLQHQRLGL